MWGRRDLRVHANQCSHFCMGRKWCSETLIFLGMQPQSPTWALSLLISRLCFPWSFCKASWDIYESAWASITHKYNTSRQGVLNNRHLLFHSFGGWKSKIKVWAGLVSPKAFLRGLPMATFLLCPHSGCPLCVHTCGISVFSILFM